MEAKKPRRRYHGGKKGRQRKQCGYGLRLLLFLAGAFILGHKHRAALGKPRAHRRDEKDKHRRIADGGEPFAPHEPADHNHIHEAVEGLQEVCEEHGPCKPEKRLRDVPRR